jgi:hypothetical protein
MTAARREDTADAGLSGAPVPWNSPLRAPRATSVTGRSNKSIAERALAREGSLPAHVPRRIKD